MKFDEFINKETWSGGYYELSIEYNPSVDDKRLNDALSALQMFKFFNGIWKEKVDYQNKSISLPILLEVRQSVEQFYGTLICKSGTTLPCMISIIRIEDESDWLDIGIPLTALENLYKIEYPLDKEKNPWLKDIDVIFIAISELIYSKAPYNLAMIGEEVSGYINHDDITIDAVNNITCILPIQLQNKLGIQSKGFELTNELRIYN
ncbi:hypothetical protein [Gottfriedia acidiceleris]|uniref:hypothetical protein n=1 Tax=Gottfriedia acidiceleris TaxID=371036 RepID=UPI002FFEBAA1